MISLGVYNHQALCKKLIAYEQEIFQLESIHTLTDEHVLSKFDLLLINVSYLEEDKTISFVKKVSKSLWTRGIFISDQFTLEQVKVLMSFGAYDCVKLPVKTSTLITILTNDYHKLMRENREKEKQEKYTIKSIRESLAYDLLHGNTKHAKEIWERSQLAKLSVIPNIVLLLSIDNFSKLVHNKGELWKNSLREEVLEAINMHEIQFESLKVLVNQQRYAILLSLPVQIEETSYPNLVTEYAEDIRREINRKTNYTVTIGIGNYYEDARNLHLSYQESEYAQSHRIYTKDNSIIHIKDLDYFEKPEYDTYNIQIQEMTNNFSLGDITAVHKTWNKIYHSIVTHHNLQPEEIRLQLLDLLFSLSKTAMENGANPKKIMPLQIKHAKRLHVMESLTEIDQWLKEVIDEFTNYVNERHNEHLLKSIQEALQYLEIHYYEDIGLEKVAKKVGLSPNYLSAIFKQMTGSSFVDHVTELRMNKAKEKLHILHLTVYEIAEMIGYSSSQYFSRVFKNNVGMTPSDYRNSLLTTQKW